eukprot:tig00020816_g14137.t2
MSPPYVEGQFAWHPQGYLTRIVSKWEERDEDDGRLHVYVRLEHWIWRDRTIRDGDGEGAARFYKCTMLKDECDARYTTDDATAKAARQRCDHSEPESGACQWTRTPSTFTRPPPRANHPGDPHVEARTPQPPSGYKQRRPGTVPPRTAPPVYPDRQPLEHFLIDPEPLADPFWNLVAQELRREELPLPGPESGGDRCQHNGFGSEAALTAYAGVWTGTTSRTRRTPQRIGSGKPSAAAKAAALRELAEAIPTDGSDFFVAPCPGTVNNNKAAFAPTSRTICERLQKSISTAEPSPPPPEGHPPRARDGQRCGRLRIVRVLPLRPGRPPPEPSDAELIAKFGEGQGVYAGRPNPLSGAYNYLSEHIHRTSDPQGAPGGTPAPSRRARGSRAHVPALAGLPIAQRMERVLNDAYDRDNHRADRLAAAALALHPCAPFSKACSDGHGLNAWADVESATWQADPAVASDPAVSAAAKRAWLARREPLFPPGGFEFVLLFSPPRRSLEGYDSSRAYRVESDPRAHVRAVCEMRNFVRLTSLESSWLGAPADRARLAREFRKQGASRDASAPFNARLAQLTKFSMELAPLLPVRARDAHTSTATSTRKACAYALDRDPPPALHSASQPETHDHAFGLCSASQAARLAMQSKIYNLLHTTITTQRLKSAATRPCTNARDPGLYPPPPCLSLRLPSRWLTHGQALFTDLSHDSPRLSVRLLLPAVCNRPRGPPKKPPRPGDTPSAGPEPAARTRSADSPHSPPTNLKATSRSDAPPPWPPLPPSEEEVLRQISSPLLGTSGSINVTRRSLSRLNGETWLDDETVVFYLALLAQLPALARRPLIFDSLDPFDFDVLLFPIHSPGHWTFAAIHVRDRRAELYDAYNLPNAESAREKLAPILRWLQLERRERNLPQTTPPPGRLHRPPDALVRGQEDALTDPNSPFDGSSRCCAHWRSLILTRILATSQRPQHPDPAPETDVPSAYTPGPSPPPPPSPVPPSLPPRYHPLLHRGDLIQSLLIFGLSPLGYRP